MEARLAAGSAERLQALLEAARGPTLFLVVAGATETSTIPGISIAGPSPEATVLTPTLDVEYLVAGRPVMLDVVPVSPEGLPTPAVITRAVLSLLASVGYAAVDAGCKFAPRVPHLALPPRRPGARIDEGPALPRGTAERLYRSARLLGETIARGHSLVAIGETIPGGTTVAAAVLEALGHRGLGRVSSSSARNPHGLRRRVVEAALRRLRRGATVFEAVDEVGDPVHVSVAGLAAGAASAGARVLLAGGTQMAAVLAILRTAEPGALAAVGVATTPWIIRDESSDLPGLVSEIAPGVPLAYTEFSLAGSRYPGLRAYEQGYVKEGVGAGGALFLAAARGFSQEEVLAAVEAEYERITRGQGDAADRG